MFDLSGQVALVTGSSRGIGYAAARALGLQGATVVLNGRSASTLEPAATALREQGVKVHTAPFDILEIDQSIAAVDAVLRSEEHTSELQSLMRISYAVFCLKKKKHHEHHNRTHKENTNN